MKSVLAIAMANACRMLHGEATSSENSFFPLASGRRMRVSVRRMGGEWDKNERKMGQEWDKNGRRVGGE